MRTDVLIEKPLVLVVDDTPEQLSLASSLLREQYRVKVAVSGERALEIANAAQAPDLILLDIVMPEMDGYEVCRRLQANPVTRDIPIIFLTVKADIENEQLGFSLGAVDYISKPISPPILLARVATHLSLKASADFLRDKNAYLEQEVLRRTEEMTVVQDVTILAMTSLAETRDSETGNHIRRTRHYVKLLAETLREHPRFAAALTPHAISLMYKSAPLHDIGKVGIPDSILLKPGRLTAEEFEIMKRHTTLGYEAIEHAETEYGRPVEFLRVAKEIALSHQEKWDGTGYPQGLAGEAIPLSARLMAIADVYDALISERVYKPAMSHEAALAVIVEGKGTHFDPDVADAFFANHADIHAIALRFADPS
nr:two-component system response regulator [uncultured Rhodoferax sp.]